MRLCYLSFAAILGLTFTAGAQAAVTQVEGSAGGGIVPWAMLHPQGPLVSYTNVHTSDFIIQSVAVGGAIADRLELSLAQQIVNAATVGNALNLDNRITQNTFGAKLKLLDMGKDNVVPQVAIGVQAKHASGAILDALQSLGAISNTSGTDWYAAATKVITLGGKNVLLNGTLRATKANQMGLLGFGGGVAGNNGYRIKPEISAGVFVAENAVLGFEYRAKPNNISPAFAGIREDAAYDIFMAYFINKNMALTAAYANLGQVGASRAMVPTMSNRQDGLYLQLQANF